MPYTDDKEIVFIVGDYPDDENCTCLVRFLSSRTIELCLSALRVAEWWKRWHDVEDEDDPNYELAMSYITTAEVELMSDCNQLGASLEAAAATVAAALRGGGGSCGTGNNRILDCLSQYTEDELNPSAAPEVDMQDQIPPEGFDTWGEYLNYKCQVAHAIVDDITRCFRSLSLLSAMQMTLGVLIPVLGAALIGTGIIAVPPAAVAVIGASCLALFAISAFAMEGGKYIADELDDAHDDIVCSLYRSSNTIDALAAIGGAIEDAIQAVEWGTLFPGGGTEISGLFGTIASQLQTNGLVNSLFRLVVDFAYNKVDCCAAPEDFYWHFQNDDEQWEFANETGPEWHIDNGWSATAYPTSPLPDPLETLEESPGHMYWRCTKSSNTPYYSANWHVDVTDLGIYAADGDLFSIDTYLTDQDHSGFYLRIIYSDDAEDVAYYPNPAGGQWNYMQCEVDNANLGKLIVRLEINGHYGDATGSRTFAADNAIFHHN